MGQGPEELRRDIERRRDDLGETIDAIGDRVSPGRIIERRRNRVVDSVRGVKDLVMGTVSSGTDKASDAAGTVRDHVSGDAIKQQTAGTPLGAGLVAFGIGFLVAAALPATEPETEAARRAQDALEPARDALKESGQRIAGDLKDDAAQAASEVKDTAAQAASEVKDSAAEAASTVTDHAKESAQSLKSPGT